MKKIEADNNAELQLLQEFVTIAKSCLSEGKAEAFLQALVSYERNPKLYGSDEAFLQSVCRLSPDKVVYISCDPQTQKRDLAVLRAGGYHVREIQPVDMFPQTAHIETVCLLSK